MQNAHWYYYQYCLKELIKLGKKKAKHNAKKQPNFNETNATMRYFATSESINKQIGKFAQEIMELDKLNSWEDNYVINELRKQIDWQDVNCYIGIEYSYGL